MIRIKAVDAQNILDACGLTTSQDGAGRHLRSNAVSIAEAGYDPEMHPNVIYNNNVPVGFFMYKRPEDQAETADICRFMVDDRFRHRGFEVRALEQILRGLRIQGVKKVLITGSGHGSAESLYLSLGFRLTEDADGGGCRYALDL